MKMRPGHADEVGNLLKETGEGRRVFVLWVM